MVVYAGFRRWAAFAARRAHCNAIVGDALMRLQRRCMCSALAEWHAAAVEAARLRTAAQQVTSSFTMLS